MPYSARSAGIAATAWCAAALVGCHAPPPPPITTVSVTHPSASGLAQTADLPADTALAATALAPYPPPPKRAEIPPPAPSPRALWQPGHWSWDGKKYLWARGRYLERPAPTANWLPGYWQRQPDGWVWVAGRWRS